VDFGPQARILAAINSSAASIDISMHHLADPKMFTALVAARGRQVAVRLIVDDDDCNARPDPNFLGLIEAGAKVRYVPTSCKIFQLSHSKYGIFDDNLVINGSANWSKAGLRRNYENFVEIKAERSAGAVAEFRKNFTRLWDIGMESAACQCDRATPACAERYCF
jgi:phosphatidylserine/phosphatidylglycerophosphate/cardiolipin synthase-like enzyme